MKFSTRKQKLVISSLQLRLIGAFGGAAVACSLFQIYLINRTIESLGASLPIEAAPLLEHLPAVLTTNVTIAIGLLTPIMLLVGLFVTHRVAGPAARMERYLRALAEGRPEDGPCRVRERDELQGLCEAVNQALERVRQEAGARAEPARDEERAA